MKPPRFVSPFQSRDQVISLVDSYRANESDGFISEADVLAAGRSLVEGVDIVPNCRTIFRWNVGLSRQIKWTSRFPNADLEPHLALALQAARQATRDNEVSIRNPCRALTSLDRIAIPTASAILAAMKPTVFSVAEGKIFNMLGATLSQSLTDYLRFLDFCHAEAERWHVTLREHDIALWQFEASGGSAGRTTNPG